MRVTFVVYDHTNGSQTLVYSEVKGNKPSEDEWESAATSAKERVSAMSDKRLSEWLGKDHRGTYSISFVLKGWVNYEENAPADL